MLHPVTQTLFTHLPETVWIATFETLYGHRSDIQMSVLNYVVCMQEDVIVLYVCIYVCKYLCTYVHLNVFMYVYCFPLQATF